MLFEEEEKKNKRIGMAVSIGLHLCLLILFFFVLAWREPNPPLPEYGIELNFGMVSGFGDEQPTTPPNTSTNLEAAAPEESPSAEEVLEESSTPDVSADPVMDSEPEVAEPTEAVVPTQPTESPVIKEVPKENKKVEEKPKEEAKKPVTTPKEDKKVAERSENKTTETKGADGTGDKSEPKASGQGNEKDKAGDAGNPEGSVDARALYGTQGGGAGGPALEISGWMWDNAPNRRDASSENGRIVFEFKIDDQGYVISIRTLETTVSPQVLQFYKDQLQGVTFSQTNSAAPPSVTTGKVTFVIKSR